MDFSVSKTIQTFGLHVFESSYPYYTSKPSTDLLNPGMNIRLYQDVVPILNGFEKSRSIPKIESKEESDVVENQTGNGIEDDLIKKSFQHPQKIKTETIEVGSKSQKRKIEDLSKNVKKQKAIKHKFQLV